VNDGTMFYFYDFEGSRKSLLFYFYLAAYRVLLGCYENVEVKDSVPLIHFNSIFVQWIQDFVAPFYLFTKADYKAVTTNVDNIHSPSIATIEATVEAKFLNYNFRKVNFEIITKVNSIYSFSFTQKGIKKIYVCEI
jgi:hypothetical protein